MSWEAAQMAAHGKIDNVVAVVDVGRGRALSIRRRRDRRVRAVRELVGGTSLAAL